MKMATVAVAHDIRPVFSGRTWHSDEIIGLQMFK